MYLRTRVHWCIEGHSAPLIHYPRGTYQLHMSRLCASHMQYIYQHELKIQRPCPAPFPSGVHTHSEYNTVYNTRTFCWLSTLTQYLRHDAIMPQYYIRLDIILAGRVRHNTTTHWTLVIALSEQADALSASIFVASLASMQYTSPKKRLEYLILAQLLLPTATKS